MRRRLPFRGAGCAPNLPENRKQVAGGALKPLQHVFLDICRIRAGHLLQFGFLNSPSENRHVSGLPRSGPSTTPRSDHGSPRLPEWLFGLGMTRFGQSFCRDKQSPCDPRISGPGFLTDMSDHGSRATGLIKARHFRIFGGGFALAANLAPVCVPVWRAARPQGQIPKRSQGTLKVARVKTTESEPFALARRWLGGEGSAGRLETVYRIGGAQASRTAPSKPGRGSCRGSVRAPAGSVLGLFRLRAKLLHGYGRN